MNEEKYIKARQMLCLFLKNEAELKGITHQQIADKTGFKRPSVSRMLLGKFSLSLENFIKLADSIGVNFFMESKDPQSDLN